MFDIQQLPSQKGRIAIITGSNIGLGYESALALAKKDLKVILACRNMDKAKQAKETILKEVPNADVETLQLDLSNLAAVREFAANFLKQYQRLDILMNNAGVMIPPYTETADGFELQFGVNHLGHFLLTKLLMPTILATPNSRVVSLSSNAHKSGKINFDDLQFQKKYSKLKAYCQSKLACLMFAYELQRRLDAAGIQSTISTAAHPGVSETNLGQYLPSWAQKVAPFIFGWMTQSAENGALPQIWAALGEAKGADYFGPTGLMEMKGKPGLAKSTPLSHDKAIAKRLWEVSEKLVGESFVV